MQRAASRRGPLRAGELAEAVVLADLTLVLSILSQVLPFLGGALLVIAIVPMAAIAAREPSACGGGRRDRGVDRRVPGARHADRRHRDRLRRHRRGRRRRGAPGLGSRRAPSAPRRCSCGRRPPSIVDALLWIFSENRKLVLTQIHNSWQRVATRAPWVSDRLTSLASGLNFDAAVQNMDDFVNRFLRYWWLSIPLLLLFLIVATGGIGAAHHRAHVAPGARCVRDRRRRRRRRRSRPRRRRVRRPTGPGSGGSCATSAFAIRRPLPTRCTTSRSRSPPASSSRSSARTAPASRRSRACSRAGGRPPAKSCGPDRPASERPAEPRSCSSARSSRCSAYACGTTSCGDCPTRSSSTWRRVLDRVGLAVVCRAGDVDALRRRAAAPRGRGGARARVPRC